MMILKIGLTLLFGAGFGLGLNQVTQGDFLPMHDTNLEEYEDVGYCHREDDFFTHMLEDMSAEEKLIVEQKIDELLIKYDVSLESLYEDRETHYDFMDELMNFLDEEGIDVHFNHYDDRHYDGFGHMGMH